MKKNIVYILIGFIFGGGFGFALGIYALPIIIANKNAKQQVDNQTIEVIKNGIVENVEPNKATSRQDSITVGVVGNANNIIAEDEITNQNEVVVVAKQLKKYPAFFNSDAKDSDFFHWGKGDIAITSTQIIFSDNVELAPGPDYRLYLIPKYLETEEEFEKIKPQAVEIAKITMFNGKQIFNISQNIDIENYSSVLIWCEAFKQFITVAKYK